MAPDGERPEDVAELLAITFAGRRDAYVAWTGSTYVTLRRPLTAKVIVDAIRHRRAVSAFFLDHNSRSHVAALDFDRSDGWELACRVGVFLWGAGIPAYPERSRGGRAHLWFVVAAAQEGDPPGLPGSMLRHALRAALDACGLAGATDIELRPATDRLSGPDGLGHALRLPTMPHRVTGERHPLCDPRTGDPIANSVGDMLMAIEFAAAADIVALAERDPAQAMTVPVRRRRSTSLGTGPIGRFKASVGVCEVLGREFGVPNAVPGRTIRCPLHDDRHPSLSIARDDSRVWCHSPGCPLETGGRGQDAYGLWLLAKSRLA